MNYSIESVFTVIDHKDKKTYEIIVEGFGQSVVKTVRSAVSRYSRVILDGFNINGKFVALDFKTNTK